MEMELDSQVDIFEGDDDLAAEEGSSVPCHVLECHGDAPWTGTSQDLPEGGLLRAGELRLLLDNVAGHVRWLDSAHSVQLFGHHVEPSLALLEELKNLFLMARKYFFQLESDAIRINSHVNFVPRSERLDYVKIREQLSCFYSLIRSYLISIASQPEYSWVSAELLPELRPLLDQWALLLQGFTNLPHYVISNCSSRLGNECTLAPHHLFHCHLEQRWFLLSALYASSCCETSAQHEARQAVQRELSRSLVALIFLAESVFTARLGGDKVSQLSPFPCTCVKEVWVLLQIVADKLYTRHEIPMPFWGVLDQVLSPYLVSRKPECLPEPRDCSQVQLPRLWKDSALEGPAFCLWLYQHLARLYGYSENGLYMDILRVAPVSEAGLLLKRVLRALLPSSDDLKEARLREVMRTLLEMPVWWPIGIDALLDLWEVFLRRINSFFTLPSEPPTSLAVISKSASGFALQIKEYLTSSAHVDEGDNSYIMFLRLLGQQLQSAATDPDVLERNYAKLRGRIYPKFQASRMQTMSELGLHHLAELMLTLALSGNMNEVGDKLQQMLESVPRSVGSRDSGKREVIWRTHLALLLLRTEHGLSITAAAEPLVRNLEEATARMTQFSTTEMQLMRIFVEALQDIAEVAPNSSLKLHVLVGKWLTRYLEVALISDVCRALDALQAVANRLGNYRSDFAGSDSSQQELFAALQKHVLPFLLQQSQTPNPPAQKLADLAVALTLAAADTEFKQLFEHFVSSESVNVRVTSRYLTQLLPNPTAMERIKAKISSPHNVILQAWVKCCLLAGESRAELAMLTDVVVQLPQLAALCGGSAELLQDTSEPLDGLAQLIDVRLQSLGTVQERQLLKDQTLSCLGRVDRMAEAALKHGKLSAQLVLRLYRTAATLVQSCAPLLYVKAQDNCLLKGLVSQLLLPRSVFNPDLPLSPDVEAALKQTLPMFVRGIARLYPKKDSYVNRTLRDIITHYTLRLAPKTHGTQHPLMACFESNCEVTSVLLETLKTSFFIQKRKTCAAGAPQALQLLRDLVVARGAEAELVRQLVAVMSESLLHQLVFLEEGAAKSLVADTLKELLNSHAFRDSAEIQSLLQQQLVKLFVYLKFQQAQLFRVLMWLASVRRALLLPALPTLRDEVAKVEALRGTGRDSGLRNALGLLESELAM